MQKTAQEWWIRSVYRGMRSRANVLHVPVMTFDEWWGLWEKRWPERERLGLTMYRIDTAGGFVIGNVEIREQDQFHPQVQAVLSTDEKEAKSVSGERKSAFLHTIHRTKYNY